MNLTILSIEELKPVLTQIVRDAVNTALPPIKNDPFEDYPEHLTRKQVKEIMRWKSMATVDNYANAGKLTKYKVEATVRFKKSEVLEFLNTLVTKNEVR